MHCLLVIFYFGMSTMAIVTRDSLVNRVFTDPKNYPYGFSRSGDFSINESKALSQYGCLCAALVDGVVEPESEEDKHFLLSAFGKVEPDTMAERAWFKYQKRINRPKPGNIYGSKITVTDEDNDQLESDSDDDVTLEVDVDSN